MSEEALGGDAPLDGSKMVAPGDCEASLAPAAQVVPTEAEDVRLDRAKLAEERSAFAREVALFERERAVVERERAVLVSEKLQLEVDKQRDRENGVRLREALSGIFDISCRALGKPSDLEQSLAKTSAGLVEGFAKIQEGLMEGLAQLKPKIKEGF